VGHTDRETDGQDLYYGLLELLDDSGCQADIQTDRPVPVTTVG